MNKFLRFCIFLGAMVIAIPTLMIADVQLRYINRMHYESVSPKQRAWTTALVLGASIKGKGVPSEALQDRLDTGIWLYKTRSAGRILITGDDGRHEVDEISTMKQYLFANNIPESDLLADGEGYRTYESCKRARQVATSTKTFVVVTQRFHLGRALYLCNKMGVDAFGSVADRQSYRRIKYFWIRDMFASVKAWWDINIDAPKSPVS
ncbi:MAG: ElyC/SanA/YdcF family protein [Candidatus Uhrbacteria bacterium]|nr:ElyC/SanA/YdcF family protein [Candidatus Uhrbacteria bacterium]